MLLRLRAELSAKLPVTSLLGFPRHDEAVPEALARLAWERCRSWLQEAQDDSARLLRTHRPLVLHLTEMLFARDTLDESEFIHEVMNFELNAKAAPECATKSNIVHQPLHEECRS